MYIYVPALVQIHNDLNPKFM